MVEVIRSATFDRWLTKLRDQRAAARVLIRINVYYLHHGDQVVLLLTGGDKSTQDADIRRAHLVAAEWRRDRL